jgi:hypothetical protein
MISGSDGSQPWMQIHVVLCSQDLHRNVLSSAESKRDISRRIRATTGPLGPSRRSTVADDVGQVRDSEACGIAWTDLKA